LDQDIGAALPYLHAELGRGFFAANPPSLTFRAQGKLVVVHGREITIQGVADALEAERLLQWLKERINDVWQRRGEIVPHDEPRGQPTVLDVLQFLPRTNCGACGQPTCQVFATHLLRGQKTATDCPPLAEPGRSQLDALSRRCRDVI
jgi:ArsR family metal-binding transcriptional regulator